MNVLFLFTGFLNLGNLKNLVLYSRLKTEHRCV